MATKIIYRFADDFPLVDLRGKTLTGGVPTMHAGVRAVLFAESVRGQRVIAKVGDKPDLAALADAYDAEVAAERAAIKARLDAIGWPGYERLLNDQINAEAEYRAADRGFSGPEAAAADKAREALREYAAAHPGAAAYAKAEAFAQASHHVKMSAGMAALRAIEGGADPITTVEEMERNWSAHAMAAID